MLLIVQIVSFLLKSSKYSSLFHLSITVFLSPSSKAFIRLSYSILIYQNYTRSVKHNCYHNNYFSLPFTHILTTFIILKIQLKYIIFDLYTLFIIYIFFWHFDYYLLWYDNMLKFLIAFYKLIFFFSS